MAAEDVCLPAASCSIRPTGRLVVFPHAGSGTGVWFRWRELLPAEVELRVARLPGREARLGEEPLTSAAAAVEELGAALRALPPLPSVLFGHSVGAFLAYGACAAAPGVARALVVSGQVAPDVPDSHADLLGLPDRELALAVGERWGAVPEELLLVPDALEVFIPTLRSDLAIADSWAPDQAGLLDVPLYVFAGAEDELADVDLQRWSERSRAEARLIFHAGGHMAVLEDPAVADLMLATCLEALA